MIVRADPPRRRVDRFRVIGWLLIILALAAFWFWVITEMPW